jgi:hypothetical protein
MSCLPVSCGNAGISYCALYLSLAYTFARPAAGRAHDDEIRPRHCGGAAGGAGADGGDDSGACGLAAKRRIRHANATERLTTKPPLCQECAKTGKHSPTTRKRRDTNHPLTWAFEDAMAPRETRWTVGLGFAHQRRTASIPSAPTDRPRPPITPAGRRTPMRCRRGRGSSGPTRKGRPRFRRARSPGSPAGRPTSAARRDSRTRTRRDPARSQIR